jgi:hypothetical protein
MEQYAKSRTSELICIPFLDSSTTPVERDAIAAELRKRGLGRISVLLLRVLAALGLWWNLVAWEWASLDLNDVLFGYAINSGLVALVATLVATVRFITGSSPLTAGAIALASLFLCLVLGLVAKRGYERARRESGGRRAAV